MRLIDADRLKDAIHNITFVFDEDDGHKKHDISKHCRHILSEIIDDAPTIKPPTGYRLLPEGEGWEYAGLPEDVVSEWIPCSESKPSEFVDVLVFLNDGTMDVVQLTDDIGIDGEPKWCHSTNYTLGGGILNEDILAWMPLPKPWKGAEDDDDDTRSRTKADS